jgi:1-acyl-sn-glycerol-3-phosphate acyltransferase
MFYKIGKCLLTALYGLDLALTTLVLYLLSFLPQHLTKSWYPTLFRGWCWIFIRALGVNLKVHQKNAFPLPKQFILIGNHPSVLEDLGMPALFKARFLAKAELKHWWILGRLSVATRTLYVRRDSHESRKAASASLIACLIQKENVALYPEGGCKGRRIHLPFQYGSFDISIKTGVPIIPVLLHYEAQEAFEWRENESLIHKLWEIWKSPNKNANYYVFDAIDPKNFANKKELCGHVENLYLKWQSKYLE